MQQPLNKNQLMAKKDLFIKTCLATMLLTVATGAAAIVPPARLAHPARTRAAEEQNRYETILYEDFSKWSAGKSDEPDETMYPVNYMNDYDETLPSDMFLTAGDYRGVGCYQAGGNIALNYPGMGGFVNFPSMEMSGKLILTARVKALGEKNTSFSITILTGDVSSPTSVENDGGWNGSMKITSADGWVDIRREIINPYSAPCWLQINAMMYNQKGIVVDYVKVERDLDYLSAPTLTGTSSFANDGFTAYWQADPSADSYLVSLYRKTPLSGEDHQASEDFENATEDSLSGEITLAEGWNVLCGFSFDGNLVKATDTPDDVFEGNQSIRLHSNDRLTLFLDNTMIKDITMALQAKIADTAKTNAVLKVIPFTKYNPGNNDYPFYWELKPAKLEEGWNQLRLSEFFDDFTGGYTRVDLIPEGLKEGESFIIDNLCGITEPLCTTECVAEDEAADVNSYRFTGLDMNNTYYFTVKSRNSTCISEPSEQTYAIGVGAPEVKEATELDKRGAFTANWVPAVNATSYTLNCYESRVIGKDQADFTVFTEDFSKAQGGENGSLLYLENMFSVELDSFADNEGWGGSGTLIGNGTVGCYTMDVYGQKMPFEMISPAIDLSHNEGNFKVDVDFMIQEEGEALIIQCDGTSYMGIKGANPNEFAHASVELTGGKSDSKLMFYTLGSTPFVLDKVVVTQNYKAGDEILTKIDFKEIADGSTASTRISGLERKDDITYVYDIVSHRDRYGVIYNSEPSEKMHVNLYETGLESIDMTECGDYRMFDLEGRQITGTPAPGIYIVVIDGKPCKVMVK